MTRKTKIFFLAVILAVGGVVAGAVQQSDIYFRIKKNFTIFSDVFREVSLNYVDEVDPGELVRRGINAMLESLDPYTVFIDETEEQNIDVLTRGNYGGVGLEVGFRGDQVVVIAPIKGYPAHRKGIRPGDVIVKVNDIAVSDLNPDEVWQLTRGEPGTTITLTIERYGMERQLTFELQRENIEVKNIAYSGRIGPGGDVGYILLNRFSQNTADEIRNAIESLQSDSELNGLILDLRNNPGGLLDEAVKTVDKFVAPGLTVVETRGRLSEHNNVFKTDEPAFVKDLPLAVIQNSGSASASEVVAGALQDLDRAVILGEQSFGKGLVQIVRPLSYNTALKITTSRYYIPSGRSIQSVTYTHDEENSGVKMSDSQKKTFKTRNGRTVYDGQGITPDIEMRENVPSMLENALRKNSHFFFFANRYVSEHRQFNESAIENNLIDSFRSYLDEESFTYKTKTEQYLESIRQRMAAAGTADKVKSSLRNLEQAIEEEKRADFNQQAGQFRKILMLELVTRYEGLEARYSKSVELDSLVSEAVNVIHDTSRYRNILGYR